jgi:tetratricopeptide (TPR) repeat protein
VFDPRAGRGAVSAEAAAQAFESEILAYGRNAGQVLEATTAFPHNPLLAAYAALAHIFRTTREGLALAEPLLARALAIEAGTSRDRLMIDAIARWHAEDQPGAMRLLTQLLLAHPDDLFAAKLLQLLQLGTGDCAGMLRTIAFALPHHGSTAAAHGMHAFALDQCGRVDEAERAARHALSLGPDPWAHHALAHVFESGGRWREGRDWMTRHADAWASCSSFLYTHNWWHAALFHLALGDKDGALALYDQQVWAVRKDYCQDQINAVSLLARLELAGLEVSTRWTEVASYVCPRRFDAIDGFLDLHYAYALARAGDDQSVLDLARCARERVTAEGPVWRRLMPAAIDGLTAFARGDDEGALSLLGPIAPRLAMFGGSTVQRDLFRRILDAARSGRRTPDFAA